MGVTPDFLKHYEHMGLIDPETKENGYRYYSFFRSPYILECMRLRNYGFTLREMREILYQDDLAVIKEKMAQQALELEKQQCLIQAVLEEHKKMTTWLEWMGDKKTEWKVVDVQEMYFLPHSSNYDFIKDNRIYEILQSWISYIPMVKSCSEVYLTEDERLDEKEQKDRIWGLIAERTFVENYKLPMNSVVKRLPGGKSFVYEFVNCVYGEEERMKGASLEEAMSILHRLGLKAKGEAYMVVLMYANTITTVEQTGYWIIPIES